MKKYMYLLVIGVFACQSKTADENPLLKEVITIHDLAMDEMGPVMSLKIQLGESIDSTRLEEYESVMSELDQSHEAMMVWMWSFSRQFPNAVLKGGGSHHNGHGHTGHGNHDKHSRSPEEEKRLLEAEKTKVTALRKKMAMAIESANQLLKQKEEK